MGHVVVADAAAAAVEVAVEEAAAAAADNRADSHLSFGRGPPMGVLPVLSHQERNHIKHLLANTMLCA